MKLLVLLSVALVPLHGFLITTSRPSLLLNEKNVSSPRTVRVESVALKVFSNHHQDDNHHDFDFYPGGESFSPQHQGQHQHQQPHDDDHSAFFRNDLDTMKKLLDAELRRSSFYNMNVIDADILDHHTTTTTPTNNTPLTNTALRYRQVEIKLLASLQHSDAAVDELVNVWIHEEPSATRAIDMIHLLESRCESLEVTTNVLTKMCRDYPTWPELLNRLALVLSMQPARRQQAAACVARVLTLKPWHFEAQHLQVLLALDPTTGPKEVTKISAPAIVAARKSLPPLSQPKRRRRWVQAAVQQAEQRLALDLRRSEQASSLFLQTTTTDGNNNNKNDMSSWQ